MAVLNPDPIVAALRGAFTRDVERAAMLRLAAERIQAAGSPYTSVYMYMLHGEELVLEALPQAELVGVDFSRPMLDLARKRLSRFGSRVLFCEGDLAEPDAIDLPHRRYKATFSIQTMHHLGDREKAAAFAWTAGLVDPGGLVAIVDRVRVEESLFEDWLVVWRRIDPTASGTFAQHIDELEKAGDRPARLEDQLAWMKAAGLDACCLHLYGDRALLVGRKPR